MSPLPDNVVPLLPWVDAIMARLHSVIPSTGPAATSGYLSTPVDVPTISDQGHVARYWVLHPFGGTPHFEQDLADRSVDLDATFQITCAAGFPRDAIALATDVHAALYRWTPTIANHTCGPLKPPDGYEPGPPRPDKDFKPYRFWVPLQYRTTITRT